MIYNVVLALDYSKVSQIYIYLCITFFLRFFSHIGHYRVLNYAL